MEAPRVSVLINGWDINNGTPAELVMQAAREAETAGLDGLVVGDHVTFYGRGNDGLVTLTAMAAVTSSIELKTSVYLLPLRHPVPVALQCAQVDQLSMGRLVLGIGIGGEDPHEFTSCGIDPRTRGGRANEAMEILRRLWTEDGVSFQGKHFQLDEVSVNPRPIRPVPMFVGGRSEAALRRAGRLGDGYTGIWQSRDRFREAAEQIATAATGAGRDPSTIELGMQFWTSVAASADDARARVGSAMEGMYKVPFERFEKYTPFGTAKDVAEFAAGYVEDGARHVNFIASQDSPMAAIERVAEVREELRKICG